MRYSKGFSSFELVCVLLIIATLTSLSLHSLGSLQDRICLNTLKNKLALTQDALTRYYARSFLLNEPSDPHIARSILARLEEGGKPHCSFSLAASTLTARVGDERVSFFIEPASRGSNPRLYCTLTAPLCKDFNDRILDK